MKERLFETRWRDDSIEARVHLLDVGVHVLLIGGCRTHVGAVSHASPGECVQTIQFPTHREGVVSEQWAKALCEHLHCPVVVNCGIHYDHVSKADIMEIVSVTEHLLCNVMTEIAPEKI